MSNELTIKPDMFCGIEYRPEQVSQPFGGFPETQGQAMKLAEFYSQSNAVPKDYIGRPGNILVAMQYGAEIGLKPLSAMQNIAVINGRPSLWGDALLGLVLAHKDNQGVEESFDIKTNTATCLVKRKGRKEITWTFSFADATAAGIINNPVWKNYPWRMAQMRARGFAIRDMWADVLKGLGSAEEQRDIADAKDITGDVELSREQPSGQSSSEKLANELGLTSETTEPEQQQEKPKDQPEDKKPAQAKADAATMLESINKCTKREELQALHADCKSFRAGHRLTVQAAYCAKRDQIKEQLATKNNDSNNEPDPQQNKEKASEDLNKLIMEISESLTMDELMSFDVRCDNLPESDKNEARRAYFAMQGMIKKTDERSAKKPDEKDPEQCHTCGESSVPLSTCPICDHVYCGNDWGINDDLCQSCSDLDDLATKES